MQYNDPVLNPNLPCYETPSYRQNKAILTFLEDMWVGRNNWYSPGVGITDTKKANLYLPQEIAEPESAYKARLSRSPFLRRFEPIVDGYAGLLSNFNVSNATPDLEEIFDDVDLLGNSLPVFLKEADKLAIRDGHCFVTVDYPSQTQAPLTALDDLTTTLRPYLVLLPRAQVVNWSYSIQKGQLVINHVTIKEYRESATGFYGSESELVYRVLTPGFYDIFRVREGNGGDYTVEELESGQVSLSSIPLVYYSVSDTTPFESYPPLVNLAEQNLLHYQVSSDYQSVLHKCNLPVPVRIGAISPGQTEDIPPLIIGPNSVVDLPDGGNFFFAEPSGNAIGTTRQAILDTEDTIDQLGLSYLTNSEVAKTATEVALASSQTKSLLDGLAEQKESALHSILYFLCQYTNNDYEALKVEVNRDLLKTPISPADVVQTYQSGIISKKTALTKLEELGIVKNVEDELSLAEFEFIQQTTPVVVEG